MTSFRRPFLAAALTLGVLTLAACGGSGGQAPAAAPSSTAAAISGSLDAADQTSDGSKVVVSSVNLEAGGAPGWIALHEDLNGNPGPVKYVVAVPSGPSANVAIATPGKIATGAYWPMLHVDDHAVGTYEFGKVQGADAPVKVNGDIVMKKIQVRVQ